MSGVPRSVWLVRHGQADWNAARRYMSVTDRPLTALGERQAQALARFFAARKVDVIVHSALIRTEATARAIKGERNIPTLGDARWREASHGVWEGLTYREAAQRYPRDVAARFADPLNHAPQGGESLGQLLQRVRQAWEDLGAHFSGRRVIVVTHSGPIQSLLCLLMGTSPTEHWRWRIDLGSATGLDCYPTTTILRTVNYTPPLSHPQRAT
ncbi:MAG: histidine phosphatase family protein [Thermoflexales bacterium]|nr:histidine phosphatase family protein [Thermoflexales bacterium]MDW8352237.1 histidine phosphatase family protein [Anaerolineae bacterium]